MLLVAVLVVWKVSAGDEYVAPKPHEKHATADPVGAQAALRDLGRRIRTGDTSGASPAVAEVVHNAQALRVRDFSASYVSESGATSKTGRWPASVDVQWRFDGFDQRPASTEVTVSFTTGPDGEVSIAGFGGGDTRLPIWLSGPVQVRKAQGTLVVVQGTAAAAREYLHAARTAVGDVRAVRPWLAPRLVLEVAASQAGFEAALDVTPQTYGGVAAVTATVDGSQSDAAPVHVFINPAVIGDLKAKGAQVVISHEAVHVATGVANETDMPLWLLEGFADYVALRDVDLPLSTTAGQILGWVRKHGAPAHLPGAQDFNRQSSHFGREYEAAWLACRVFADEAGQEALVRLYDEVNAGRPVDAAMRSVAGFGVAELNHRWRERLETWAR